MFIVVYGKALDSKNNIGACNRWGASIKPQSIKSEKFTRINVVLLEEEGCTNNNNSPEKRVKKLHSREI